MVSYVVFNPTKGLRVLNRKGIKGSILDLYRLGQGQILHLLGEFLGYELGGNSRNGGKRGGGQGEISYSAARHDSHPTLNC
jgi:hypothetical protein